MEQINLLEEHKWARKYRLYFLFIFKYIFHFILNAFYSLYLTSTFNPVPVVSGGTLVLGTLSIKSSEVLSVPAI